MAPCEHLANAIILRAVEDYREAIRMLAVNPRYSPALHTVLEVERFFRSGWFSTLTTIDGISLMKRLKEECYEYDS